MGTRLQIAKELVSSDEIEDGFDALVYLYSDEIEARFLHLIENLSQDAQAFWDTAVDYLATIFSQYNSQNRCVH